MECRSCGRDSRRVGPGGAFVAGALAAMFGGFLAHGGHANAQGQFVQAPFIVADRAGNPILEVTEGPLRQVIVRSPERRPVLTLNGLSTGGMISLNSADTSVGLSAGTTMSGLYLYRNDKLQASLASEEAGGSLAVADLAGKRMLYVAPQVNDADARVSIGTGGAGAVGVRVFSEGGTLLAALGAAVNGSGALAAYDTTGKPRAVMSGLNGDVWVANPSGQQVALLSASGNQGVVAVKSAAGTTVSALTIEREGGGLLELAGPGGTRQAVMGVSGSNSGIACVINQNGPTCLGPSLPGIAFGR